MAKDKKDSSKKTKKTKKEEVVEKKVDAVKETKKADKVETAEEIAPADGTTDDKNEATTEEAPKKKVNPKHKWYVLNIRPGYENAVAEALTQRVEATESQHLVSDILVPTQKKIVIKNGKQTFKEEKIFPGYVLINMELDENTWSIISSTDGVRGFVKTDKYPRPLPEREVKAIMKFMEVEQPAYQATFSIGEAVKIIDGAFADFIGSVSEIDSAKGKVQVMVTFLGREAPVEVDFSQVSKL